MSVYMKRVTPSEVREAIILFEKTRKDTSSEHKKSFLKALNNKSYTNVVDDLFDEIFTEKDAIEIYSFQSRFDIEMTRQMLNKAFGYCY